tara:strand:+ start:92 stop:316 length:225 start_codon:yes stop_codon:yes gene_type:complete
MTEFISVPLPLAILILTILALSFIWSFRLAIKLDRLQAESDERIEQLQKGIIDTRDDDSLKQHLELVHKELYGD